MINKSFETVNILKYALNGSLKRNQAISNNIANVNTPNYKKVNVNFENALKKQLEGTHAETKLAATHEKHFGINREPENMLIKKTINQNSKTKKDGNNVNIDMEMANLAKNSIMYNAMIKQVSSQFSKIRSVINDGR